MDLTPDEFDTGWKNYYKMSSKRAPREFLVRTLNRFDEPGNAVDLGCGIGTESIYMLEQGWQVLAIDQFENAIQTLLARAFPTRQTRLETRVALFDALELPRCDFVWASLSLPFTHPSHYPDLWEKITSALRPGGRFAGDFFGDHHAWANREHRTFHTKDDVLALCDGMELEYLIEEEGFQQTANDGMQHWHQFTISVRKQ